MDLPAAERFRRADSVFDAALDVPPEERQAFVERACAGDPELLSDVERLLRAHSRSDGFLSSPAARVDHRGTPDAPPAVGYVPRTLPDRIGPYRIEREIGRGGMGVVYLAERDDPNFRQRVALKVVSDAVPDGRAHVTRFLAERQLLVSLEHPHIARLFDGGVTTDGLPYYTMAFCEGGSLADRLGANGGLPTEEAMRIARELASALGAAHARGIVHRDVKPGNVLFDASGAVRLTDFGIAKLLGADVTRSGAVLGTVAYLAPEQVLGEPVDQRADLWALGVTLYEMLTGKRPFGGSSYAAVIRAIVDVEPESVRQYRPDTPAAIDALVASLLQKDPASRTTSAAEVVRALDEVMAPHHGAPRVTPAGGLTRVRRFRVGVAIGVLGVFAAIAGYVAWRRPTRLFPSAGVMVRSIAVLPFENSTASPNDDPFIDGFTDEMIGTLAKVRGLAVTARSSAFALRRSALGARATADTLGVDYLLDGNVRHVGPSFVMLVQLVRPRDGTAALWSQTFRGDWKDVFTVQPAIARAVAEALRVQFALSDPARGGTYSAADSLYLLGRFALYGGMDAENMRRAEEYFKKAIADDSMYAKAYSGLSDIYTSVAVFGYGPPAEASEKAHANANRALALDSTLAEARTSLAHALCTHDYQWKEAEQQLRGALERSPSYSYARRVFAICLLSQGRFDEAIAQLDTARRADPLNRGTATVLGRVYVSAGRTDDAIRLLTQTTQAYPESDMAWEQLGHAYLLQGKHAEAIAALRAAARLVGVRDSAQLAYGLARTNNRAEAERIVQTLLASRSRRYIPPFHIAMAYAGLGRTDDAFNWLDLAFVERASFMNGVKVDPAFRTLHADPRWGRLLAKMGLD